MQRLKFLVLTDHRGHSANNSLYVLIRELAAHPQCASVVVASRGNRKNDLFFLENKITPLWAIKATADFSFQKDGKQFLETEQQVSISDCDAIFMRLPRPITDDFLRFLIENAKDKVIFNHPKGILKTSSKEYLVNFPSICPPIRLCYSIEAIMEMVNEFPIVLKPLKEYGGKGLLRINGDELTDGEQDFSTKTYLESVKEYIETEGYLAMKFLKNVSQGDKRLLVVDGEIMAAFLRMPKEGSWLCNVAQGGEPQRSEPTEEELNIVKTIAPKMREEGVFMYGADTLVDDDGKRILSEINTLSIGGFISAEGQDDNYVIKTTIKKIIKYVEERIG